MCTVAVIGVGVIFACVVVGIFCCIIFDTTNFANLTAYTSCCATLMIFKGCSTTVVANVVVIFVGISVRANIRLSALTVTNMVGVFIYVIVCINRDASILSPSQKYRTRAGATTANTYSFTELALAFADASKTSATNNIINDRRKHTTKIINKPN